MSTPSSPAVRAEGLTQIFSPKGLPQVTALKSVTLSIPDRGLTALVGPDGAGKTTFLRLICGLLRLSSGTLEVLGWNVRQHAQDIQSAISYMPQKFGLYEDLSVQENMDLYADLHGIPLETRQKRFSRLLSMTDLAKFTDRPAGKLSGGMKQKLALACTLVRSPRLLLLDEPTVGVDPLSRRELWLIVQELVKEEGLAVLLSTTYLDEAAQSDHVFVLHEGQLLAQGTPAELAQPAQNLCFSLSPPKGERLRTVQARLFDDHDHIVDAVPRGGRIQLITQPGVEKAKLNELASGLALTPRPSTVEDGFMVILSQKRTPSKPPALLESAVKPADSEAPIIEVRDLVRTFGNFTAVASTNFSVKRGEVFGLLGPNGAGKTTTFRMLCGLLPASSGFLQVAGVNLRTARAEARNKIGYVSQKFALYGNLSVDENLRFFGRAYGLTRDKLNQRIDTVLTQFELTAQRGTSAGELPGGFKQRLSMAVGLLHEPEVLFLDEPTSGADAFGRREFWRRITALSEGGTTIVITTHFMEEAEYCDRIVIQDAGKIIALGTPEAVRQQTGKVFDNMDEAFIAIVEAARGKTT